MIFSKIPTWPAGRKYSKVHRLTEWDRSWTIRLYRAIRDFIIGTYHFIGRCIYYAPVLWRDRDWDHTYILILLRHKLVRVHKAISANRLHEDWTKDAHNIQLAIEILDRLIVDEYYDKELTAHYQKWDADPMANIVSIIRGNKYTRPHSEQEHIEFRELTNKMHRAEEIDWLAFWGLLSQEMRNWWD